MEISYNFHKVVPIQVLWRLSLQKEIYFRSNLLHLQIIKFSYQIHKSINIHESKGISEKKKFGRWNGWYIKEQMCQVCWCDVWEQHMWCYLGMEHVTLLWEWNIVMTLWEMEHVMIEGNGTNIVG